MLKSLFILPLSLLLPLATALSRVNEPGLMGSGTYPRATRLRDGTLLGCITTYANNLSILTAVQSTNNGWDWTTIGSISRESATQRDHDNCFVHQLPSGRILASFRNHDRVTGTTDQFSFYRLTVCFSDDKGVNWKYLSTPVTSGTPGLGLWEPFLMDGLDGSVMLYYSRETNTNGRDQDNFVRRSRDGGVSWSAEVTVSGGGITTRDGMVGVARLGAGSRNLIAVFESLAPDSGIQSVTSSDDGLSWGNRRLVWKTAAANQAPQVVMVGSTLVASFQTDEDGGKAKVKVVASTNGGASWGQKTTVLDGCNWAGELVLDSTSFVVMCEAGGKSLAQHMIL